MRSYRVALVAVAAIMLFGTTAAPLAGEKVQIKWNGDYPHNNERVFSDSYKLGWSKNFMNGFPEEHGVVQREGHLPAEIFKPKGSGPFPLVILMHGCGGMDKTAQAWVDSYSDFLLDLGAVVVALDSFTPRKVQMVCGKPWEGDWARRRSQDAYSALDYMATTGYIDMARTYAIGRSNGATALLMAAENIMARNQPHKFTAVFPLSPGCRTKEKATFLTPMVVFVAGEDDANRPGPCIEMGNHARLPDHPPLKVVVYDGAFHGYLDNTPFRYFMGWRMGYSHSAAQYTKRQIVAYLRGDRIESGVERK